MDTQIVLSKTAGGILLVAGTSIGAGMLALPVVTSAGGLAPAIAMYFVSWLFMSATGLLMLELCLRMPPGSNLLAMAGRYLGWVGKSLTWVLYLFLFYCLSVAYVSGGGGLIASTFSVSPWLGSCFFVAALSPVVLAGAMAVNRLNAFLMLGLIGTYFGFILLGLPHVDSALLERSDWRYAWIGLPVIFTSFSYQGVIPSLTQYLNRDAKQLRLVILGGTTLTFFIYLIWEIVILGIIPNEGAWGLTESYRLGQTAIEPLQRHIGATMLMWLGESFAFLAITTSFLGVMLGLFDFLSDGFGQFRSRLRQVGLACLTFAPPLLIACTHPSMFIAALVLAGGIGCAILLGLMPTLMVWVARYRKQEVGPEILGGGRWVLMLLGLFVVCELITEFC
ncbi:MAG: tyrosine-specific transport protein [Chlamydiota bacterium]|jgi:tyrosine-specific transport protein